MKLWYLDVAGMESGPYEILELQQMSQSGILKPESRIRKSGEPWVTAKDHGAFVFPDDAPQSNSTSAADTQLPQKAANSDSYSWLKMICGIIAMPFIVYLLRYLGSSKEQWEANKDKFGFPFPYHNSSSKADRKPFEIKPYKFPGEQQPKP